MKKNALVEWFPTQTYRILSRCIHLEHLSLTNLANAINDAFLGPMQELDPFTPNDNRANRVSDQFDDIITPWETYEKLKASGPDEAPNFVFKEHAEIFACLVSSLIKLLYVMLSMNALHPRNIFEIIFL